MKEVFNSAFKVFNLSVLTVQYRRSECSVLAVKLFNPERYNQLWVELVESAVKNKLGTQDRKVTG